MDSTLIIACGALAEELAQLRRINGWSHVDIQCLPPSLHNYPDRIPAALEARLAANQGRYRRMFAGYADCGTGGALDEVLRRYGVERLPGAHCYETFAGRALLQGLADEEPGTFFLTDFLVRHFERLVIEGLGLDRHPQLMPVYFGHYRRVVYLAQSANPGLESRARHCAARLGLEYAYRFTGLDRLQERIAQPLEATVQWRN